MVSSSNHVQLPTLEKMNWRVDVTITTSRNFTIIVISIFN